MSILRRHVVLGLLIAACAAGYAQKPGPSLLILKNRGLGALSVQAESQLVVGRGDIAVNSEDDWAVVAKAASLTAKAGAIRVVGGTHSADAAKISPQPQTGAAATGDPYAGGPQWPQADRIASAQTLMVVSNTEQTLRPGLYMGGIKASGTNIKLHLEPGVYFLHNGGIFLHGAELQGEGVTIILYGPEPGSITLAKGSQMRLSAPNEGPLQHLVLIAGGKSEGIQFGFSQCLAELDGVIYAPVSQIGLFEGAEVKAAGMVAWSLSLLKGSRLEIAGQRGDR